MNPDPNLPPAGDPVLILLGLCLQVAGGELARNAALRAAGDAELAARAGPGTSERIVTALRGMGEQNDPNEFPFAELVALHALALDHRGEDRLARPLYEALVPAVTRHGTPAQIGTVRKNFAGALAAVGQSKAALAEYEVALDLLRTHGDPHELALGLVNRANLLSALWKLAPALADYDEALPLLRAHGTPDDVAFGLMNRALVLTKMSRLDEALAGYDEAIPVLRQHSAPAEVALCEANRAELLRQKGEYADALDGFEAALPRLRTGQPIHVGIALLNWGNALRDVGKATGAVAKYDEALPIFRQYGTPLHVASCQVNRALVLTEQGQFAVAEAAYDELLPGLRTCAAPGEVGAVLLNRSLVRRSQGKLTEAAAGYEEALPLLRQHPHPENYGLCLLNYGEVLWELERHDDAEAAYTEALSVLRTGPPAYYATCRMSWGNALFARDHFGEAVAQYALALGLFEKHGPPSRFAECLAALAAARHRAGDTAAALAEFDRAVPRLRDSGAPLLMYVNCLMNRAVARREAGRRAEAVADYTEARRALRAARRYSGADDTTLEFHRKHTNLFQGAVYTALAGEMTEDAYDAARDGKAGVVGDIRHKLDRERPPEPAEVGAARRALTDWLRTTRPTDATGCAAFDAERDGRTRTYLAAWGRHVHTYDAGRGAVPEVADPPARRRIQEHLPERWALVDFWHSEEDKFHAFVLFRDDFRVVELPFPFTERVPVLQRLYDSLRELTDAPNLEGLNDLGVHLFRPLLPLLREKGITGLYLVPHDILHVFPLHAARWHENGKPVYLCDAFDVACLPSANLLPDLPRPDPSGRAFVLANPEIGTPRSLQFAHWEGLELRRRFWPDPEKAETCFLGAAGTYAATDNWADCGLVHFSCHGQGDEAFAPRAHLCLADDLLLAHDVIHRKPPLKPGAVVILNGCRTGVPDWRALNEGMGLMTAFLLRGAGVVFSTQWSVLDICAAPMVLSFAEQLRWNAPPTAAMRAARETLRTATVETVRKMVLQVRALFPPGAAETGRALAKVARACLGAGFAAEAAECASAAAGPLRAAGLEAEAELLLDRAGNAVRRPAAAAGFDSPMFWGAFQLVGRVV